MKGHDTCGSSTFKAGQSAASSNHKGLDETGLLCQCCRHGVVLRCANLKKGENYRVVHYMHNFAFEKNVRFFCYDIVCRYWDFAKKVGESFPQCKDMTENMRPFLSRFHGKAHGWDCQVIVISFAFFEELLNILFSFFRRYGVVIIKKDQQGLWARNRNK